MRVPAGRAVNDPATDLALTFALRYTRPVAIVGIVAVLVYSAWVLTL